MNFTLRFPTEIIFGNDTINQIGTKARQLGNKAFLVTGKSAMRKAGYIDKIIDILKSAGVDDIFLYDQAEHDPSVETVDKGVQLAKEGNYNVVIGIGGGSAMDTGKTIASLMNNEGSAGDYQSGKEITNPGVPFIAVPTTAGTGAEITNNSVITNREKKIKQSIRSPLMIAKVAIVDPVLTKTMPPYVTASSGMDALTQAIETYVSLSANPFSDTLALRSISIISQNLYKAFENGDDMSARENMAMGSLFGAMAFANSALGAVHGLAHPIGALFDVPHGVICGLLLPYVMEYNLPAKTERFAQIAKSMDQYIEGESDEINAHRAIEFIHNLITKLKLPKRLSELGITRDDLPLIAKSAKGSSLNNNPRPTDPESLVEIMLSAL
ncbi:TPA: iron-containing alcohol dehydrogenase [Candidatus Poribacteria bacterium]|nr:iron-containing alcohol dehydrogenase [Candidatus Poribacteria bacterium]